MILISGTIKLCLWIAILVAVVIFLTGSAMGESSHDWKSGNTWTADPYKMVQRQPYPQRNQPFTPPFQQGYDAQKKYYEYDNPYLSRRQRCVRYDYYYERCR